MKWKSCLTNYPKSNYIYRHWFGSVKDVLRILLDIFYFPFRNKHESSLFLSVITQPPCDPETERKRGFMTCMSHIKQYLDDNNLLKEKTETSGQNYFSNGSGDVSSSQPANTQAIAKSATVDPLSSLFSIDRPQMPATSNHGNIFNKICLDFLNNNTPIVPYMSAEQPVKLDHYPAWQPFADAQSHAFADAQGHGNTRDSSNDGAYQDEINLPYESFLASINDSC